MLKRFVTTAMASVTALLGAIFGTVTPASAQGQLVVTAYPSMAAGGYTYPVSVQLQDGAGRPVYPAQPITVHLKTTNPAAIDIYENVFSNFQRRTLTLSPPDPATGTRGNTFGVFMVVARNAAAAGTASIVASSSGYGEASAPVTVFPTQGVKSWPPAQQLRMALFPPIVEEGAEPFTLLQFYGAHGGQTYPSARISYKLVSSDPRVVANYDVVRDTGDPSLGGHSLGPLGRRAEAPGTTQLTIVPQGTAVRGGSAVLTVVARPSKVGPGTTPGTTVVTPPPPPPPSTLPPSTLPPSGTLADITKDIVINQGAVWEGNIAVSRILDLHARLGYAKPAGSNPALDISINGRRITSSLLNKGAQYTYKDGRTFPYYTAGVPGWHVFYSPDYSANNSGAGGGYQVMTDPGQAYHYRWDVSALAGGGSTMRVRIAHTGVNSAGPLVIRFGSQTTIPTSGQILIERGMSWEQDIPATNVLDLHARLEYAKPAGSNPALDISINGRRITSSLLNKGAQYTYKDGRTFPYYTAGVPGWHVFYSPDYSANNSGAGGGYQVMTDPGQAYHYRWDVSALAGGGSTMRVRISHVGVEGAGRLVIQIGGQ